ncbi:hypothetical protein M569_09661, partial [Genlisea aurea]
IERNVRVDDLWQKMNKGVSSKTLKSILETKKSPKKPPKKDAIRKSSTEWMAYLGLGSKKTPSTAKELPIEKQPVKNQMGVDEDAKRLAAAALSAVKEASLSDALARGKVEVTEVRDFAGEDIEVKKLVDASSKEAAERGKTGTTSAVDAVLEQIKKKPKLSVLDKTKKDWGEYKEENKGMEEELDAYKKSSNQYLDKVSFLQRADYREFERERDVRLASQAKRKTDMRE